MLELHVETSGRKEKNSLQQSANLKLFESFCLPNLQISKLTSGGCSVLLGMASAEASHFSSHCQRRDAANATASLAQQLGQKWVPDVVCAPFYSSQRERGRGSALQCTLTLKMTDKSYLSKFGLV